MNRFLKILASSNRIDVLITIRQHLLDLKPFKAIQNIEKLPINIIDSGINSSGIINDLTQLLNDSRHIILITHHEARQSSDLRKRFKYLIHNLKENCPLNFLIVDINSCYDEQNLNGTIQKTFEKANQVLLVASTDYKTNVVENGQMDMDYKIRLKYFVHDLMNNEYIRNGMRNQRFRIVLLEDYNSSIIPIGWPTNTIQYQFPQAFKELCQRLFEK